MTKLRFNNVTKHFGAGVTALSQFSLSVDAGELVVLVGPSGCGKSTALRLLAGLETVSAGEIVIDDVVVNHMTPQQRNIAMVFQNYALYPHLNVRDNLAFPLRMAHLSKPRIAGKVDEIARILNLTELLQRRPKQLSGGQRQRVAMGRALVRDPRVFLLDEPLSNLDARLRAQIRADIAQIQQRLHKTTVYVTHDQVEAMTLGDRVAAMNNGELQQVGTPAQLYAQPSNIFVARFIGSPGMNIAPSTAIIRNDAMAVRIGDLSITLPMSEKRRQQISRHDNVGYIGIRPEAFSFSKADQRIAIKIGILSVEYLGHESLVYFRVSAADSGTDEKLWIARISGQIQQACGQNMELYVDPDAVYLFDSKGRTVETV